MFTPSGAGKMSMDPVSVLHRWDRAGRILFTTSDLQKILSRKSQRAFELQVQGLTSRGVLKRAARGVYVLADSAHPKTHMLEAIAAHLRRGQYNYLSLESALSEHGWISQIPVGRITVMTTGRRGEIKTIFGTIEYTHTDREVDAILSGSIDAGRPLRIATAATALRDLRRVGRNLHLVEIPEDENETGRPDP